MLPESLMWRKKNLGYRQSDVNEFSILRRVWTEAWSVVTRETALPGNRGRLFLLRPYFCFSSTPSLGSTTSWPVTFPLIENCWLLLITIQHPNEKKNLIRHYCNLFTIKSATAFSIEISADSNKLQLNWCTRVSWDFVVSGSWSRQIVHVKLWKQEQLCFNLWPLLNRHVGLDILGIVSDPMPLNTLGKFPEKSASWPPWQFFQWIQGGNSPSKRQWREAGVFSQTLLNKFLVTLLSHILPKRRSSDTMPPILWGSFTTKTKEKHADDSKWFLLSLTNAGRQCSLLDGSTKCTIRCVYTGAE